jgi:hypothetical protein
VVLGDKLLISRSASGPVLEVFGLLRLMEFPGSWRSASNLEVQKLEEKNRRGVRERVIEMTVSGRPWRKVFLNASAPIMAEIEHKGALLGARYPYRDFESRVEFQDYMEFHGHQFPRKFGYYESNVDRGEIQVLELTDAEPKTPEFDPPPDSHWIHRCPHPKFPKLIPNVEEVRPIPPPQFRAGAPRLHAEIYGIIGTDGHWHNLTAVKSAGQAVDSYLMNVMQRTGYSPAQCDGIPVEYEYVLGFDYP